MEDPAPSVDPTAAAAPPPSAGPSVRTLRLAFVLPSSASRPELLVPAGESVAGVKDRLAALEGDEAGGYTLIAQGRVLGDGERVGECFSTIEADAVNYIHVVKRHAATTGSSRPSGPALANATAASTTRPPVTAPASPGPLMLNPTYLALHDTSLFLAFRAARALDIVLGRHPRGWDGLHPPPRVSEEQATRAVKQFLEGNGMGMGEGIWETKGREVRDALANAAERGEEASLVVDVDGIPNKLVIPDPRSLSDEVVCALGEHQHYNETIRSLEALQKDVPMYIPFPVAPSQPTPTPTTAAPTANPAAAAPNARVFAIQLRLSTLPLRLLPTALASLLKVLLVLWMLTRHMRWTDRAFIGLAAAGGAWWIWECAGLVKREREREAAGRRAEEALRRVREEREAREAGRGNVPARAQVAGQQGEVPPVAPRAPLGVPELPNRRRNRQRARTPFGIALHGLDHERRRLRLFYIDPRVAATIQSATDHRIPASDANLPIPPRDPNPLWTWLVMPIYLFLVAATPPADAARKMAIRQREVHMRLLVQKLTQAAEEEERRAAEAVRAAQPAEEGEVPPAAAITATESVPHPPVLPRGLSKSAERYYRRVLAKGETVDWEEEREAQAALLREAGGGGDAAGEEIAFF